MAATALVQARIDPELRDRAAYVLGKMGMTLSDAVRILLTRVANERGLPIGLTTDPQAHDAWFKSKVMEALAEHTPAIPAEDVEAHFARRRAIALQKSKEVSE